MLDDIIPETCTGYVGNLVTKECPGRMADFCLSRTSGVRPDPCRKNSKVATWGAIMGFIVMMSLDVGLG